MTAKWYDHVAGKVAETDQAKILCWDLNIQTDHVIEHRRPDVAVLRQRITHIIYVALPGAIRVGWKEV